MSVVGQKYQTVMHPHSFHRYIASFRLNQFLTVADRSSTCNNSICNEFSGQNLDALLPYPSLIHDNPGTPRRDQLPLILTLCTTRHEQLIRSLFLCILWPPATRRINVPRGPQQRDEFMHLHVQYAFAIFFLYL